MPIATGQSWGRAGPSLPNYAHRLEGGTLVYRVQFVFSRSWVSGEIGSFLCCAYIEVTLIPRLHAVRHLHIDLSTVGCRDEEGGARPDAVRHRHSHAIIG